jgi:hypothetical protein
MGWLWRDELDKLMRHFDSELSGADREIYRTRGRAFPEGATMRDTLVAMGVKNVVNSMVEALRTDASAYEEGLRTLREDGLLGPDDVDDTDYFMGNVTAAFAFYCSSACHVRKDKAARAADYVRVYNDLLPYVVRRRDAGEEGGR